MIEHSLTKGLITLSIGSIVSWMVLLILKLAGAPLSENAIVLPLCVGLLCVTVLLVISVSYWEV